MNDKFELYIIGNKLHVQKNHDEYIGLTWQTLFPGKILNNLNMGSKLNFDNFTKSIEVSEPIDLCMWLKLGFEECGCSAWTEIYWFQDHISEVTLCWIKF